MNEDVLYSKDFWESRALHRNEVIRKLNVFLTKKDKESLIDLISELWASGAFKNTAEAVKIRILNKGYNIGQIAQKLELTKVNPQKLLEEKIPGFGPASITEILFCLDPNKHAIFNRRSRALIKTLGYGEVDSYTFDSRRYQRFLNIMNAIYEEFEVVKEDIERNLRIRIPKFDFVDALATLLYENRITIKKLRKLKMEIIVSKIDKTVFNYALESIQSAVKQYLHWIEAGVPGDLAADRAVNYALGVISSSGALQSESEKQKLVIALETMAGLAKDLAELIKSTLKDEASNSNNINKEFSPRN